MNRKVFRKWDRAAEKEQIVEDIKDNICSILGDEYKILQTPIIFDVDLVDILLVNRDGVLTILKVLEKPASMEILGKVALDYSVLEKHKSDFLKMYPKESIDPSQKMLVKLFVPEAESSLSSVISRMNLQCDLFQYDFVMAGDETGLVVNRLCSSSVSKHQQDYSSILKIMGENVRSESSHTEKADYHKYEVPIVEKEEPQIVDTAQTDVGRKKDVFDIRKLSEEELVAFFDLEKKLDDFHNKG